MDIDAKKSFLQQGSELYDKMVSLAPSDTIRRFLAFRIIVNAMSFEDLVRNRQHPRLRKIRDVLLAHKQEDDFFEGYKAADDIRDATIKPLIAIMNAGATAVPAVDALPELVVPSVAKQFESLVKAVLKKYFDEEVKGHQFTNNFLSFEPGHAHEISQSELAGCFFRYNSSKALMTLAEFLTTNLQSEQSFEGAFRHAKLDLALHAINMADCAIRDVYNRHSIDGLREIMLSTNLGNPSCLDTLNTDGVFRSLYEKVRGLRNKLVGHMDVADPLQGLLRDLDNLPPNDPIHLARIIDHAVHTASLTDSAIKVRYDAACLPPIKGVIGMTELWRVPSYY